MSSQTILHLAVFLIFLVVLAKSGSIVVKYLSRITRFLRVSEFTTSLIIMGIATTLPELFVGITSAIKNNPALSLGNVIGSNIVDLTLIIAIPILLSRNIDTSSKTIVKDVQYMFIISLIPILFMLDHILSRLEGLVLIVLFFLVTTKLLSQRKKFRGGENEVKGTEVFKDFGFLALGLFLLITSASLVVRYASLIATDLQVPSMIIGLFLIAFGTSLPELMFGIKAALSKKTIMSLGNATGSVITNSTLVLGITALISPITANFTIFISSAIFLVITTFLFTMFIRIGKKLTWREAIILLFIYILFIIVELINVKPVI